MSGTPDAHRIQATAASSPEDTGRRRGWRSPRRRWLVAAALVLLAIVLIGPGARGGPPLDPRSTGALGTAGVLEVVDRLGTDVRIGDGLPRADEQIALVIQDRLEDEQRQGLRDWVADGGRLVLADPYSDLAPDIVGLTTVAFTEPSIEPACDDPLVAGVERVVVSGGIVMDPPPDAVVCFPRNGGVWLVREALGSGELIVLGGPFTLTNEALDREDTAVLLANLLTSPDGGGLHVVTGDLAAGEETLTDLLPDQVGLALLQIPLAWLALVWWRARRHGRPVDEPGLVRIDASETTVAVGNLLHRAGRAADAAAIVRSHVHRQVGRRVGIADALDPDTFIAVAAARSDVRADTLRRLLVDPLPSDDDGLVAFTATAAQTVGRLRQRRSADPVDGSTAASATTPEQPDTSRSTAP